ncbi:hypothetical protein POM88_040531 [Heracleum sosnowskyi]|uniref:Kinesin motor domain-containing protein n=1 Tax=Heracleum sosnowskyi TaxID=360622 RepID=A0AAD8HCG1_9APIA|nr:hypothetical protein POM88_040531 [Heracleum sosnowskyi]
MCHGSDREYQIGDELAWYADGDKIVRNEYNLMTSYAFDKVFGPSTATQDVYELRANQLRLSVAYSNSKNSDTVGTVFAYGVTSSGKTHAMHLVQSNSMNET